MVRGFAGGYGYDKASAAAYDAAKKLEPSDTDGITIHSILKEMGGRVWNDALRYENHTGTTYKIWNAV